MSRYLDNSAIIRQCSPGDFWRISLFVSPGPKWLITFCLQFLLQRPWLLAVDGTARVLPLTSFSTRIQTRSLYMQKWGFILPTVSMPLNVDFFSSILRRLRERSFKLWLVTTFMEFFTFTCTISVTFLWGTKSQKSIHRPQFLKRKESRSGIVLSVIRDFNTIF